VLYADDILLFAPSLSELQQLFKMCELELEWLDMSINIKKSGCMRIGSRFNIKCENITSSSNISIPWVKEFKYLGVSIVCARKFKCSLDNAKRAFYRSANAIFGKVARAATEEVVLHLIDSKCIPILLYGLEACPLNISDNRSIDFTVNRFFMKLFCSTNPQIIADCQLYFGFRSPSELLAERTCVFIERYRDCDNLLCRLVG
jgi:hypothetical protein